MAMAERTGDGSKNDGESETVFETLANGFSDGNADWSGRQVSQSMFGRVVTRLQAFVSSINICDRGCSSDVTSLAPQLKGKEGDLEGTRGFDQDGIFKPRTPLNTITETFNQADEQSLNVAQEYVEGEEGNYERENGGGILYGGPGEGSDTNYEEP
jgi:hypothetical protein